MNAYLYILRTKGNHYYIGSTNNLERRLSEHKSGKTKSLKKLLPIDLVFYQRYDSIQAARSCELKLKRFRNKKIIERIITEGRIITTV